MMSHCPSGGLQRARRHDGETIWKLNQSADITINILDAQTKPYILDAPAERY